MIYFDTTRTAAAGHQSGLTRVSRRLRTELGADATSVTWDRGWRATGRSTPVTPGPGDWVLTPELFAPDERVGWSEHLEQRSYRLAAIFHDAIPLKHPHITWPQSVARHPGYLKMLARFDRVRAVSAASREELLGFWRWQGVEHPPPVDVLPLGADFAADPRVTSPPASARGPVVLLCVGILEPRKNQVFLLDVCDALWRDGLAFELHLVGRVNPHFGRPVVARLEALRRQHGDRLQFHEAASDAVVATLYASARASLFPTIAEGCGLPLLESLWRGVPCVHSDLPVLRENAAGGGCVAATVNDASAWAAALRRILTDDARHAALIREAVTRPLPTWRDAADTLRRGLAGV